MKINFMIYKNVFHACVGLFAVAVPVAAFSEENDWWVHAGVSKINFESSAKLTLAGAPYPGGNATATDSATAVFEIGRMLAPSFSASATIGVPPKTTVRGAGSVQAVGTLGQVTYAPFIMDAQYWLLNSGPIRPYIGAGVVYTRILNNEDGALSDLKVKSCWGSTLQVGAEMPIGSAWGVFIDVKKIFLKTKASGTLATAGGAPVSADVTLNPWVFHAGVAFHF